MCFRPAVGVINHAWRNGLGGEVKSPQFYQAPFCVTSVVTALTKRSGAERGERGLDCYWAGSLDLNFLGNQGVFHEPPKGEKLFAGGSLQQPRGQPPVSG